MSPVTPDTIRPTPLVSRYSVSRVVKAQTTMPWIAPSILRGIPASRPATQPPANRESSDETMAQMPWPIPNPLRLSESLAGSKAWNPTPRPSRLRTKPVTSATNAPAKIAPQLTRLIAAVRRP